MSTGGRCEYDVVVVGGVNTDYLVRGKRLPVRGENVEGDVFQEAPGGKGANQAVAVVRLGGRAALIARIGSDDRGTRVLGQVAAEAVGLEHVRRDGGAATGVAVIMVDRKGDKQSLSAPGANRRVIESDLQAAQQTITSSRVLLLQLEIPLPAIRLGLRLARTAGVRTVLDAGPAAPLPDDILRLVDLIRSNAVEAEALTGIPARDRDSAARAARVLLDRGVGAAVVQAGEAGNLLVAPGEERLFPLIQVESVDSTGAGDAFSAALAVGLAEGRPLSEAAAFGNAAAALTTTKLGAQAGLPRREEVRRLLDELAGSSAPPPQSRSAPAAL